MRLMLQYLEPGPHLAMLSPSEAAGRLRETLTRLALRAAPLEAVLLGWDLPEALVEACAREAAQAGARLYLWHPLLTAQGTPPGWEGWRVQAADGSPVPGHAGLPEFTFLCPNHPEARDFAVARLCRSLADARYAGVFLDRIRWPSPAAGLEAHLGCFCPHCVEAAREAGIDLAAVQRALRALPPSRSLEALLGGACDDDLLSTWVRWRMGCITAVVAEVAAQARRLGKSVGLDVWSPALAPLVGQSLPALGPYADWVKIMTYGRAWGPAGLPFEIALLARWLASCGALHERQVLSPLATLLGLPLPADEAALRRDGLAAEALAVEVGRARALSAAPLLAGLELVEIPGVCTLQATQVRATLSALRGAGVDGLVLSWDLWRIPLERLEWIFMQ